MRNLFIFCFLSMFVCGCGPNAKQLADQQARQRFRESVAAVKVCTQGATYQEFREKWLALETCYTINQTALTNESAAINQLLTIGNATDTLWNEQVQLQNPGFVPKHESRGKPSAGTKAMRTIEDCSGETVKQLESDGGFDNYVRHGLALISSQCDDLLK